MRPGAQRHSLGNHLREKVSDVLKLFLGLWVHLCKTASSLLAPLHSTPPVKANKRKRRAESKRGGSSMSKFPQHVLAASNNHTRSSPFPSTALCKKTKWSTRSVVGKWGLRKGNSKRSYGTVTSFFYLLSPSFSPPTGETKPAV